MMPNRQDNSHQFFVKLINLPLSIAKFHGAGRAAGAKPPCRERAVVSAAAPALTSHRLSPNTERVALLPCGPTRAAMTTLRARSTCGPQAMHANGPPPPWPSAHGVRISFSALSVSYEQ